MRIFYRFRNRINNQSYDNIHCVYWNFNTDNWSNEGCHLVPSETDPRHTVCECHHLTNFAALLDISGREQNNYMKSLLTYIFCSVSVLCLLISIILMLKIGNIRFNIHNDRFRCKTNRTVINFNIAICLLMINFLTMFGMDQREIRVNLVWFKIKILI